MADAEMGSVGPGASGLKAPGGPEGGPRWLGGCICAAYGLGEILYVSLGFTGNLSVV